MVFALPGLEAPPTEHAHYKLDLWEIHPAFTAFDLRIIETSGVSGVG